MLKRILATVAVAGALAISGGAVTSHADDPPIPAPWDGGVCPAGLKATILLAPYTGSFHDPAYVTSGPGRALLKENFTVDVVSYDGGITPVVEVYAKTFNGPILHTKIVAEGQKFYGAPWEGQYLESVGWSVSANGRIALAAPTVGPNLQRVSLCLAVGTPNPPPNGD